MSELKYQLDNFLLESIAVAPNPSFNDNADDNTGQLTIGVSVATHNTEKNLRQVKLDVKLHPKDGAEDRFFPYLISVSGKAFFSLKDGYTEEVADRFLNLQGASQLYGFLRGQVTQITALGTHGQFLLPPANFVEMYNDRYDEAPAELS
jgi:preprotein translocase subunit SecB